MERKDNYRKRGKEVGEMTLNLLRKIKRSHFINLNWIVCMCFCVHKHMQDETPIGYPVTINHP